MSIIDKTDEGIIKVAEPIWANLVRSSNIKDYGGFTKDLSSQMLYGANEVELGKQWANNELISTLSEGCKAFGCIRRGLYVTILYKQTSTKIPGEFLGRLVLGDEGDQVKVFGATIFYNFSKKKYNFKYKFKKQLEKLLLNCCKVVVMSILKDLKKKHKQIAVEIIKLTKLRLNDRFSGTWKSLKDLKKLKLQLKDKINRLSHQPH